nr:hypothetical protein [uncultured Pseudomonas sp.]
MIYTPLPGEYVASAVRRGNELLGLNSLKLSDYLIKTTPENHRNKTIYPPTFVKHRVAEEVLRENTLYPLAQALGRQAPSTNYTPTARWKICLQCIIEDIEKHGTSYIHRRNILPAVTICSLHATKLHEKCPSCLSPITTHKLSNFEKCRKLFPATQSFFRSSHHEFAIFVSELLSYNGNTFISKIVDHRIFEKLVLTLYNGDHSQACKNIIIDVNKEFGLHIRSKWLEGFNLNTCSILAFLGYQTSEAYLDAMSNVDKRSPNGFLMSSRPKNT